MPQKKIDRKANNDIESGPICCIDRVWYDSESERIVGDMYWSFDQRDETYSKDPVRLHNNAVNCIVSGREDEDVADFGVPIYLVMEKDSSKIMEIVVPEECLDDKVLSCIREDYGSVALTAVGKDQTYIEVEDVDMSMARYNAEKTEREVQIARLLEAVRAHGPNERVPMAPIAVHGLDFNAISWRTGIDGRTYYVLGRPDGSDIVGMVEDEMFKFLDYGKLEDLTRLAPSIYGSGFNPDIEELLYSEMTVGGNAIDCAVVFRCTEGYSKEQMAALKTSLQTRLTEFYDDLKADGHINAENHKKNLAGIDSDIQSWLGPWPLLVGKMDCKLDAQLTVVTEKNISDVAERQMAVHSGSRKNIAKWAVAQCEERGLDRNKLSASVKKASQMFQNSIK